MPRRKCLKTPKIGGDQKVVINSMVRKFMAADQRKLEFPPSLTIDERAHVHRLAVKLGLKSKSQGSGDKRFLVVQKPQGLTEIKSDDIITLKHSTEQSIYNCICHLPLTEAESADLLPLKERTLLSDSSKKSAQVSLKPLSRTRPQVPRLKVNPEVERFRQSLPIMSQREEILQAIDSSRVVVVAGETGCGKTTQIPQFILERCQERNQTCKIICTQPRRLSAVSVAERVAYERGERIGQTFGYQIRLESKVSSKTLLTYCTNGVLLRILISENSPLSQVTHVIVDEVHERDRFCDFLLIALKDALLKHKQLKIILMSATIDTTIFSKYFNNCPVINLPGKLYQVEVYYLEDVLKLTSYVTKDMTKRKKFHSNKLKDNVSNFNKCNSAAIASAQNVMNSGTVLDNVIKAPCFVKEMDETIEEAWLYGEEDRFTQLLYLINSENVSVNYQHSKNFATTLMIAAGRGYINFVQTLLNLGADLNLKSCNDWTAYDWAKNMNQMECMQLIEAYKTLSNAAEKTKKCSDANQRLELELNKQLLDAYHSTFNDENIDYELVSKLIVHIHLKMSAGSILIFLPGYDDIMNLKEHIAGDAKLKQHTYNIYILHSNMQTGDQKLVFKPSPRGTRKIILSTNIAETSITINDVVYVIDCGKVKEKSYDALSGVCSLQSNWISQACAKQRAGRAGRCQKGTCYRIYSTYCYENMQYFQTPEMLRLPLQQLCLYTKQLMSKNTSISNFLGRAIEPPSNFVIENAIQLLKKIDALDSWEDLTELGKHLLDLPIEPRLGKMLVYGVLLRCLNPILTIVSSLSYRNPFIIPINAAHKQAVTMVQKEFAGNSYSDHMIILKAFESWMKAKTARKRRDFCEKNFISFAVMEMITGMRTQLLVQLKASGFVNSTGKGSVEYLNSNSKNWSIVKAALTAGLYPNIIRVDEKHNQLKTQKEMRIAFHSSSILKDLLKSADKHSAQRNKPDINLLPYKCVLYEEINRCGRFCQAKSATMVNSLTVAMFSGPARLAADTLSIIADEPGSGDESDSEASKPSKQYAVLKVDDWIAFKADPEVAKLIFYLKQKWNALFLRRMKGPHLLMSEKDEQFMETLVSVLSNEEAYKLEQPLNSVHFVD